MTIFQKQIVSICACAHNRATRIAYQLGIKVPVLFHRLRRAFFEQIPKRAGTSDDAKDGDHSNPDIQEARSEVKPARAQRAPTLTITA
jgi:hypothetical protein